MPMYEITIERTFAASHAIRLPDGQLEPIHGHNWPVAVTVERDELDAIETVMDFHDLEAIVDKLVAAFHNRHLNDLPPFAGEAVNPTAERVAWWIGSQTAEQLPEGVRLQQARVGEAPGCWATYRPTR
ncbi:6-pyruvoyl tetrahydropterin synthase family protein [Phycisphaerales bacterium AB-hyl4]|uniref:6-carboxy-5,6,7,8-tetrahydropterin synthase n=1 Tax=Natronomicrosphaera hydrolytica TaxID=3242702 RepID=A0ABV4U9H6_9BACT